jgi:hypothetical protein
VRKLSIMRRSRASRSLRRVGFRGQRDRARPEGEDEWPDADLVAVCEGGRAVDPQTAHGRPVAAPKVLDARDAALDDDARVRPMTVVDFRSNRSRPSQQSQCFVPWANTGSGDRSGSF